MRLALDYADLSSADLLVTVAPSYNEVSPYRKNVHYSRVFITAKTQM